MVKDLNELIIDSAQSTIQQIKGLITSGQFNAGDRLPSERKLAIRLGVGRAQIRDAISKLEFYGMLKIIPQSGSVVTGDGINAFNGIVTNMINFEAREFSDLVETRLLLETQAVKIAAMRRTTEDIINMNNALNVYEQKIKVDFPAMDADLFFHLQIAEAGKNAVLKSLIKIIIPDILKKYTKLKFSEEGAQKTLEEHKIILEHIVNQQPELAAAAMVTHLGDVMALSKSINKDKLTFLI